jgi:hypothetical protein
MKYGKVARKYKKGGIRKVAKYAVKRAGKAVYNRYAKGGIKQVVKDVSMLKALVNVEKKYVEAQYAGVVGQVNANVAGLYSQDITPIATQGIGYNQRTGQSYKLTGATIHLNFNEEANQDLPIYFRVELWKVVGNPQVATTAVTELYDVNPLTTIIDINSDREPNFYADYKKICSKRYKFPDQQYSSQAYRNLSCKIHLKLNHHIRLDKNSNTLNNGQIIMVVFASNGNTNSVTPSTLPYVANPTIKTGLDLSFFTRFYYVDN